VKTQANGSAGVAAIAACGLNGDNLAGSREAKFANRIERFAGVCDHVIVTIGYNQHVMRRKLGGGGAQRIGITTSAVQQRRDSFGITFGLRRSGDFLQLLKVTEFRTSALSRSESHRNYGCDG
jgi:hypothetical protein